MTQPVDALIETLTLERLEETLFRGRSPQVGWQRVFGGQVIGQALAAAHGTVEAARACHSLHGYFIHPGDPSVPIVYGVDRLRDGRSFSTRHVRAIQHGRAIFTLTASFHGAEDGLSHGAPMPEGVPTPEALPGEAEFKRIILENAPDNVRRYFERPRPIELRPVDLEHYFSDRPLPPVQYVWVRTTGPLPDETWLHQSALGYLSDMTLLDTALFAHGRSVFNRDLMTASLDHAMWFHRPFRADGWLLYAQDSPAAASARGFARGSVYTREGVLVASATQEGLIRIRRG